tara:strand:- start:311 stop:676 length:366 start_codon:yes stop_codon:yes gene_type:complete
MTKLISFFVLSFFVINIAYADLPVPRWVSLKGDANLRKGPTEDATIIYRYQLKGYPMEILRDIDGWRYVRDPLDGVEAGWHNSYFLARDMQSLLNLHLAMAMIAQGKTRFSLNYHLKFMPR